MHRVGRALLGAAVVCATGLSGALVLAPPVAADAGGGAVTDDSGIDYGAIVRVRTSFERRSRDRDIAWSA